MGRCSEDLGEGRSHFNGYWMQETLTAFKEKRDFKEQKWSRKGMRKGHIGKHELCSKSNKCL